jgi:hypothetical protein
MKFITTLQNPVLKAVAALANNGGIFKKRAKAAFNPKITLGFNFFTNSQKMNLNYCPCAVARTQRFPAYNVMKAFVLVSVIAFSFTSCQKDAEIAPKAAPSASKTSASTSTPATATSPASTSAPTTSVPVVKASTDTIPDKAAFKIKLGKDSTNTDETLIMFDHTASLNYSRMNDAPYLSGFGQVSLANVSADGVDIAIKSLPYTSGMSIGLDVHAKADGAYFLKMSFEKNIPSGVQVLIKDTYLKDSVDVRKGNYNFNITKADTNSFGRNRFKIVVKSN